MSDDRCGKAAYQGSFSGDLAGSTHAAGHKTWCVKVKCARPVSRSQLRLTQVALKATAGAGYPSHRAVNCRAHGEVAERLKALPC